MTYTVGDRKINIEEELSLEDKKLVLSHQKLFKFCLNQTTYKYLINLKNIIHLYSDIITIYSSLLKKIPSYDDITLMTSKTKLLLLKLEEDFNKIFGENTVYSNDFDINQPNIKSSNWQYKHYENDVKKITLLILESCNEAFGTIIKNLNCIDFFFNNFDNLKKLLIPYLLVQSKGIQKSLTKSLYLFKITTIVDQPINIDDLNPEIMKQLRKIEKITTGIERESIILYTAFKTFDPSLQQYTSILLGKAILKRDIDTEDCRLIKRREICFQAAEYVVSIPLTEAQSSHSTMKQFLEYAIYIITALIMVIVFIFYRLCKVLF